MEGGDADSDGVVEEGLLGTLLPAEDFLEGRLLRTVRVPNACDRESIDAVSTRDAAAAGAVRD